MKRVTFLTFMACSILFIANSYAGSNGQIVASYYANWNGADIGNYEKLISNLDEVFYSFAKMDTNGNIILTSPANDIGDSKVQTISIKDAISEKAITGGNFLNIKALKTKYPSVKFILSIGGWGNNGNFSTVFANEKATNNFIANVNALLSLGYFSGVDIDWEYPRTVIGVDSNTANTVSENDTINLQNAIIKLRKSVPDGTIISLAIPHGNIDPDGGSISNFFVGANGRLSKTNDDFISAVSSFNLMSYDFMAFATRTVTNAPLNSDDESINDAINILLDYNVPSSKILLGIPAYGRCVGSQTPGSRGLITNPKIKNGVLDIQLPPITSASGAQFPCVISWPLYSSINMGKINNTKCFLPLFNEAQTISYWGNIKDNKASKIVTDASTISSLAKYQDFFMSFDSPFNVAQKCLYVEDNNLQGVFFWEMHQDKTFDSGSIDIYGEEYPLSLIKTAVEYLTL